MATMFARYSYGPFLALDITDTPTNSSGNELADPIAMSLTLLVVSDPGDSYAESAAGSMRDDLP